MTNYEKYKDIIIDMLIDLIAVNKHTGVPVLCDAVKEISCDECLFKMEECENKGPRDWLNAEYIEPSKDNVELSTLIAYLKQEPNQMKRVKSIMIVDGVPVINGGE